MNDQQARAFSTWGFDRRGWRPKTRQLYVRRVGAFTRHIAPTPSSRAGEEHVWSWLSSLPATAASRNVARSALLGYYDFLCDTTRRTTNPVADVPVLREPKPVPKALTRSQAAALLGAAEAAGPRWAVVCSVGLHSGLRISELLALEWSSIMDGWATFEGKGGQQRTVPLHPHTLDALGSWRPVCGDPRWVLPSTLHAGQPASPSYVRTGLRELGESVGIVPLKPHMLRHTCGTSLLESGANVRLVQDVLGHRSLATTQRYLTVWPGELATAVASNVYAS